MMGKENKRVISSFLWEKGFGGGGGGGEMVRGVRSVELLLWGPHSKFR